jgi:small subunit ribosomal protein S13
MSREFRHIVRISGADIDGSKKLVYGITKVRGLGVSLVSAIVKAADLKPEIRVGNLTESDVQRIEDVIGDPVKYGIPPRLVNRRKDLSSGRDQHLIGADLTLATKTDIDFMKDIKSWRGLRHQLGLKVRGQRTRTTGRKGKAVGVKKKLALAAARAAAMGERDKEKK